MDRRPGSDTCNSAVYVGQIRHRRFVPGQHSFTYPLFMLYLDLDEIPALFASKWFCSVGRLNLVNFKREDFFSPESASLKMSVIDAVTARLGNSIDIHHVRALMHVRYLNIVFNPVVFYYCFDADDQAVAILAEITNTPWGERHHYVLPVGDQALNSDELKQDKGKHSYQYCFDKSFHVSPFNPMNMRYRWIFSIPETHLLVHMENRIKGLTEENEISDEKHFDATLTMKRKDFRSDFAKILIQFPFLTVKVITGIYWQAFKLWCKRMPFYDHPDMKSQERL